MPDPTHGTPDAPASEPVTAGDTWTVYMCVGCEAFHRQLFLLDHAEGCTCDEWTVTSVPRLNLARPVPSPSEGGK